MNNEIIKINCPMCGVKVEGKKYDYYTCNCGQEGQIKDFKLWHERLVDLKGKNNE